jgi:hypothetical protein
MPDKKLVTFVDENSRIERIAKINSNSQVTLYDQFSLKLSNLIDN